MKNGKKPLSSRGSAAPINMDDIFGNQLGVNPELVKVIESEGNVHRFINAKRLEEMGGQHPTGWRPYRPTEAARAKMDADAFIFGNDPHGFIRRGDCILAVRPKELNEKHKAYLKQEAARAQNAPKSAAEQIRNFVKANGLDMRVQEGAEVHEGFGSDEDDNE